MAKTKKKFYAIKYGINPKTKEEVKNIILTSWKEVEPYIKGVKGAKYSGFITKKEAEDYLKKADSLMRKKDNKYPKDCLHCYVDGSFNKDINNYSYGLVCVKNSEIIHFEKGLGRNKDAIGMQQIGGELLGAMKALLYAKKYSHNKVVIFHDYEGTCYHATGYWKRDNEFSKIYYNWMQDFFKNNTEVEVNFCKVDAHTGDDFNEIADGLAKLALKITPPNEFYKLSEKYNIDITK
ncbi:ribonuclease H1 domain-containing protein [Defluviitalea phaphyphila]|uniref:ribonuclease H1 domain-containing protein n=1 Tax=Defluviitalea phaphyphila TaxID=1473580 RepID=UPI00072FF92C|nr:ribonuclease H family protein [Defluviitalea phaphyphila]